MKLKILRIIATLLLCCMILPLFSCGGSDKPEETTTKEETTPPDSNPTEPDEGELKILFGKDVDYQFVCENGTTGIWDFPQQFQEKTGLQKSLLNFYLRFYFRVRIYLFLRVMQFIIAFCTTLLSW